MADIQLIRGSNGNGPAVRPVVTAARSSGSLTIKVNSTTNLPPSFIGTWGKLNQDTGKLVSSSIRDFYGTVNGADIDLVRMADGFTDDGNQVGDVIVLKPNTDWANNLADALEVSHNPDGTLKDDSVTTAALADDSVTTGAIANGSVTPAQLNAAARGDYSTNEVNTGRKWIGGQAIFEKTINLGALPNATTKNVAHGVTIGRLLGIKGHAHRGGNNAVFSLPHSGVASTSSNLNISVYVNGANIVVETGVDRSPYSGYVTIEYIK